MLRMGVTLHTGDMSMAEIVEYARLAEELGYDGFWPTEESGKDAFQVLAVLAGMTRRIRLGTGIVNVYSRSPTLLAMSATTLDRLSGGRAFLGLGTGGIGFMERGHGIAIERPLARMREYLAIIRRLLAGERMSYEGRFFRLRDFHLRERPPRADLPLYVAALNPRMIEVAGEAGDGVILNFLTPEHLAEEVRPRLQAGAARAGRDPGAASVYTLAVTCVEPGAPGALAAVKKTVAFYCASPHYHHIVSTGGFPAEAVAIKAVWDAGGHERATRMVPDEMVARFTLSGTSAKVRRQLEAYARAGVYPIIYPIPRQGSVAADMMRAIRLVAEIARG
ncbi:MAG: LLM class flavin-dependent oxidoreductase [Deltaproteobacteria bacterium]|nr:LLM class flavin-dependent oxidoreductase [Deltaproteobacteria bacterium]